MHPHTHSVMNIDESYHTSNKTPTKFSYLTHTHITSFAGKVEVWVIENFKLKAIAPAKYVHVYMLYLLYFADMKLPNIISFIVNILLSRVVHHITSLLHFFIT